MVEVKTKQVCDDGVEVKDKYDRSKEVRKDLNEKYIKKELKING